MSSPANAAGPSSATPRQPLLWAALAYGAGIVAAPHIWRPATWWIATVAAFLVAAAILSRGLPRVAQVLAMTSLACIAILTTQLRLPVSSSEIGLKLGDGSENEIIAHVTAEGEILSTSRGGLRQTIAVETEDAVQTGLRLSIFTVENSAPDGAPPFPAFHYGDRIKFSAKLRAPHNYHNPGAFDFRGYMQSKGLAASASVRADRIERLPGFVGTRFELWRNRAHRSIIAMIHTLWPPEQAALVDAMVIGDDAFIDRDTRMDFQRSGTYHILVVSGMNVSILAFVTFGLLRRLRAGSKKALIFASSSFFASP